MAKLRSLAPEVTIPQPRETMTLQETNRKLGEIVVHLSTQLYDIRQTVNQLINGNLGEVRLDIKTAEPVPSDKVAGMVVYADGATWNPGSGAGIYRWSGAAWVFLG